MLKRFISKVKFQFKKENDILMRKRTLEISIQNALNIAIEEIHLANPFFSEEALRYIVMNELSNKDIFGNFPNSRYNKTKLLFEKNYDRFKRKKTKYKPDISSINQNNDHLLAVELKIAKPSSAHDLFDIDKCIEYIRKDKGKYSYELAASIYAVPHYDNWHKSINELLNYRMNNASIQGINIETANLIIGFIKWEENLFGKPKAKIITAWI
jgi:hypothetical protein